MQVLGDEDSQYCANVVDRREVERRLVVTLCMPDVRERVADQMDYRHSCAISSINPLERKGNYSATSNMGGLLHLVQRGGTGRGRSSPMQVPPRCTKCNSPPINDQCTNHRTAV